jgi:hypothetical protein
MVQTVTGNLLEEQTAVRFEFFKGVNSITFLFNRKYQPICILFFILELMNLSNSLSSALNT